MTPQKLRPSVSNYGKKKMLINHFIFRRLASYYYYYYFMYCTEEREREREREETNKKLKKHHIIYKLFRP